MNTYTCKDNFDGAPNEKHYSAINNDVETEEPIDIIEINAIVLSQSCDIVNDKSAKLFLL